MSAAGDNCKTQNVRQDLVSVKTSWHGKGTAGTALSLSVNVHRVEAEHGDMINQVEVDFLEMIDDANCCVLSQKDDKDSFCVISMQCPPDTAILRLVFISDSGTVEIFDSMSGYVETSRGDLVEECEGMVIYGHRVVLHSVRSPALELRRLDGLRNEMLSMETRIKHYIDHEISKMKTDIIAEIRLLNAT